MEITIQISDDRLEEIIKGEEGALTKDELHDVILKGVTSYIENHNDLVENMFIRKDTSRYGCYGEKVPTPLLESIVKKIDITEDTSEIRECVINTIKNNMPEILANMFAKAIASQAFAFNTQDGLLQSMIHSAIIQMNQSNR